MDLSEIVQDFRGRRKALKKAIYDAFDEVTHLCKCANAAGRSCSLFGFPDGRWELLGSDMEVPMGLPRPPCGINWRMDTMTSEEFNNYLLEISKVWLLDVAYHLCDHSDRVDPQDTIDLSLLLPDDLVTSSSSSSDEEAECDSKPEGGTDPFPEGQSDKEGGGQAQDKVKNSKEALQSAKPIEEYHNKHNTSASTGLSDPSVATGISDLSYESRATPTKSDAWAANLGDDDVLGQNAPAMIRVNEFLVGMGTDAPDVGEENITARPSAGYDDMFTKTLLEAIDFSPLQGPPRKRKRHETNFIPQEDGGGDADVSEPEEDLWKEVFTVGTEWHQLDLVYQYNWNFTSLENAFDEGGELYGQRVYLFGCTEPQMVPLKDAMKITHVPVVVAVVSAFPPSGINSVQREAEEIVPMKRMKMDWVLYIPLENRDRMVERLKSEILSWDALREGSAMSLQSSLKNLEVWNFLSFV